MIGKFRIKKIFYGLGYPAVGLAADYVADGQNLVTILNEKQGKLTHPGMYEISGADIRQHPLKQFKGVPAQYFVPIVALKKVSPYGSLV